MLLGDPSLSLTLMGIFSPKRGSFVIDNTNNSIWIKSKYTSSSFPDSMASNQRSSSLEVALSLPFFFFFELPFDGDTESFWTAVFGWLVDALKQLLRDFQ